MQTYYPTRYIYKLIPMNITDDMIIKLHSTRKDYKMPILVNAALIQDVYPNYNLNNEFTYSEIYSFGRSICVMETPDEIYDMINNPRY